MASAFRRKTTLREELTCGFRLQAEDRESLKGLAYGRARRAHPLAEVAEIWGEDVIDRDVGRSEPRDREQIANHVEVAWTSGGIRKLGIYRRLGVAEVWYC